MTSMAKPNILLVDDDKELTRLLNDFLTKEGFDIVVCHDTQSAQKALAQTRFDVLVLDAMLPDGSGFDVLERVRKSGSLLPIIMLTALDADTDRISGLEMGADDYVPKPCNPRELAARLRAILRRSQRAYGENLTNLRIGLLELRWKEREVLANHVPVALTATEFDLLALLMCEAGKVVDKEYLSQELLGRALGPFDRSIDMHVSCLRRKLGNALDGASPITTIRGNGYVLRQTGSPK